MNYLISILFSFFLFFQVTATDYTIPVVVHIVYNSSEENIPDNVITSQIQALNRDYQNLHDDLSLVDARFTSLIGNPNIKFVLANYDTLGNAVSAITRTETDHVIFGNDDIYYTDRGGKDAWDPTKYLNIWVCNLQQGILGQASFPDAINEKNGVVIDYEYFGQETAIVGFEKGRTTVHEVGHWLGLSHPEGVGGCDDDDGIIDTPIQGVSYSNCNIDAESCGSSDMVQNFMQTNDDDCLLFFTAGQVERMHEVLINERQSITKHLNETVSVSSKLEDGFIQIYPTIISSDAISITFNGNTPITYYIFATSGEQVFTSSAYLNAGENEIAIPRMKKGMYTLQLLTDQNVMSQKIYVTE